MVFKRLGVIPAAGRGTRFGHLSKRYPKCILPFKDKPIIIRNIEWLKQNGCDIVNVVINFGGEQIRSIIDFYQFDYVNVIEYDVDDGVAGSVLRGSTETEAEELLVILSDLISNETTQFTEDTLSIIRVNETDRWCCVDSHEEHSVFFDKQKDSPSKKAISGIYFCEDKKQFDHVGRSVRETRNNSHQEFQLSEVLSKYSEIRGKPFELIELGIVDFGTLPEYLKNRSVKISREFNEVVFTKDSVVKRSLFNGEKLFREVTWYDNVPKSLQRFTPKIYSRDFVTDSCYEMERIDLPSLREMFVFYDNDPNVWEKIGSQLLQLVRLMRQEVGVQWSNTFWKSVVQKTKDRSGGIFSEFYSDFEREVAVVCDGIPNCNVFHGDLCFSNILYDFDRSSFKLIDPRGDFYGSWLYDLAKLNHSFVGMYDVVDTEMYVCSEDRVRLYTRGKSQIANHWDQLLHDELGEEMYWFVQILTASLFLSMIPLHSHNKTNQQIYLNIYNMFYSAYKSKQRIVFTETDMEFELVQDLRC